MKPLKAGDDSRKNWRTINEVQAVLDTTTKRTNANHATVNALNKHIKDSSGGTGSVSYEGTWDDATAYAKGSIVRKKLGTMQGVYIAKEDAAAGQEPTYPESAPWDLLCFGVIEYEETADDISGQLRTIYVNASDRL